MIHELIRKGSCEFIAIDGILYHFKIELTHFDDLSDEHLSQLELLLNKDLVSQASLDILKIHNPKNRLQKFGLCNFGGFDMDPDIDKNGVSNSEYYDCGKRGSCPVEGKLCKHVKVGDNYINPREIEVIKLITKDLADKQIADQLKISINTAQTHRSNIQHKIGCNSKVGICRWAIEKGIV